MKNSDRELINQLLQNNKKATKVFYKTYKSRLWNFIKRKVKSRQDAEEILQDVFVSSLLSLPAFSNKSSFYTWLCSIANHEICDFYRKKKIKTIVFSRFPFLEKLVSKALGPELALQEQEIKQKIYHTFKEISEGYCQILRLKYIDGLSMAEIAQRLGKTVKAVESKLFRARMAFQKQYSVELNEKKLSKKNWQILNSSFNKGKLSF